MSDTLFSFWENLTFHHIWVRLVTSENTRRTLRHDTLINELLRVLGEGPQGFPWGHPRDVAGTKTDATEPPWDPHGDPGGSQASHRGRKTAASSAQRAPKGSIGPKGPRGTPRAHICAPTSAQFRPGEESKGSKEPEVPMARGHKWRPKSMVPFAQKSKPKKTQIATNTCFTFESLRHFLRYQSIGREYGFSEFSPTP